MSRDRPLRDDDLQSEADQLFSELQERRQIICWGGPRSALREELLKRAQDAGQRVDFAQDEFGLWVRLIDDSR